MIFIGTDSELKEIPFDKNEPDFHLEKITGDYLDVKSNFSVENIYYVGTSRGCGCDFRIANSQPDNVDNRHDTFAQVGLRKIRTLLGTQADWESRTENRTREMTAMKFTFLEQTNRLIDLIEKEVQEGRMVELYCCWADDYKSKPNEKRTIKIDTESLRDNFDIEENELLTFA
jgi:hypothetical protein